jgi:hypothetical protein
VFTLSIAEGLALSALYEGFARGLVSLHTRPLLGRKPSSVKSRVSISSKLIEIKGLQLHYFGHLRKSGGEGELPAGTYRLNGGYELRKETSSKRLSPRKVSLSAAFQPSLLEMEKATVTSLSGWSSSVN